MPYRFFLFLFFSSPISSSLSLSPYPLVLGLIRSRGRISLACLRISARPGARAPLPRLPTFERPGAPLRPARRSRPPYPTNLSQRPWRIRRARLGAPANLTGDHGGSAQSDERLSAR